MVFSDATFFRIVTFGPLAKMPRNHPTAWLPSMTTDPTLPAPTWIPVPLSVLPMSWLPATLMFSPTT